MKNNEKTMKKQGKTMNDNHELVQPHSSFKAILMGIIRFLISHRTGDIDYIVLLVLTKQQRVLGFSGKYIFGGSIGVL